VTGWVTPGGRAICFVASKMAARLTVTSRHSNWESITPDAVKTIPSASLSVTRQSGDVRSPERETEPFAADQDLFRRDAGTKAGTSARCVLSIGVGHQRSSQPANSGFNRGITFSANSFV